MTPIKLYLDEDVRPMLAEILNARGFVAVHTLLGGNSGTTDYEQLTCAANLDSVLVTHNTRDFTKLHKEFISEGKAHSGIICSPQVKLPELIARIIAFLSAHDAESVRNQIFWI